MYNLVKETLEDNLFERAGSSEDVRLHFWYDLKKNIRAELDEIYDTLIFYKFGDNEFDRRSYIKYEPDYHPLDDVEIGKLSNYETDCKPLNEYNLQQMLLELDLK